MCRPVLLAFLLESSPVRDYLEIRPGLQEASRLSHRFAPLKCESLWLPDWHEPMLSENLRCFILACRLRGASLSLAVAVRRSKEDLDAYLPKYAAPDLNV